MFVLDEEMVSLLNSWVKLSVSCDLWDDLVIEVSIEQVPTVQLRGGQELRNLHHAVL